MNVIIINKTATVIESSGTTHINPNLSDKEVKMISDLVLTYTTNPTKELERQIIEIVNPLFFKKKEQEEEVVKEITKFKNQSSDLLTYPEFKKYFDRDEQGGVFYKGYKNTSNVILPPQLLDHIKAILMENADIKPFIRFWELCLANPDSNARNGLFKFVKNQKLMITPNGYIVCYRRAQIVTEEVKDKSKIDFILKEVLRLRRQKGSLDKYSFGISKEGEFHTLDHRTKKFTDWKKTKGNKIEGTYKKVADKYEGGQESSVVLTDAHTKTMRFGLGSVVSVMRRECDNNPSKECSNGLHIGSRQYVSSNSCFGSKSLLCLVNPSKVVSVPYADGHKMRVCEYKIIGMYDNFSDLEEFDNSDIRVMENEYLNYEVNEIKELLSTKTFVKEDYSNNAELFLRYAKITESNKVKGSNLKIKSDEMEDMRRKISRRK